MSNILNLKGVKFLAIIVLAVAILATFGMVAVQEASADCSINSTLRLGSTGAEVVCLQTALGALTPDGKFGPMTQAAVMAFQSNEGLTADGVFGPMSRAAWMANQMTGNFPSGCNSATGFSSTTGLACYNIPSSPSGFTPAGCTSSSGFSPVTGGACQAVGLPAGCTSTSGFSSTTGANCSTGVSAGLPAGCMSTSGFSSTTGARCDGSGSTSNPNAGGGEASLESFNGRSGDDSEVEEGSTAQIADFEFDVEDGSVRINRVDLAFETSNTSPDETDPWKVFDTVTLLNADGDEIASADVSDKSDWLEDDPAATFPFTFRFTGLDELVSQGDTAHVIVEVEAQNSIDGASGTLDWDVSIPDDGLRAIDQAGFDQFTGEDTETVSFDVTEAGGENDYDLGSSNDDPDAGDILVDDANLSDDETVFAFELDVDSDSTEDLDFQDLAFNLVVGNPTGGDTSITQADVINEVSVMIDGVEYDADALTTDTDDAIADAGTDSAEYVIDNDDGDIIVPSGEIQDVIVKVKFKGQTGNYDLQTTISGNVDTDQAGGTATNPLSDWNVVGVDSDESVTNPNDVVTGETHTLSLSTATISGVSWVETSTDLSGSLDLFFTVTAEEDDFDVLGAEIVDDATGGVFTTCVVNTPAGNACSLSLEGTLERISGDDVVAVGAGLGFTVSDNDTVRFRVRYAATAAGSHEVTVTSVAGQELDDEDQLSPTLTLD